MFYNHLYLSFAIFCYWFNKRRLHWRFYITSFHFISSHPKKFSTDWAVFWFWTETAESHAYWDMVNIWFGTVSEVEEILTLLLLMTFALYSTCYLFYVPNLLVPWAPIPCTPCTLCWLCLLYGAWIPLYCMLQGRVLIITQISWIQVTTNARILDLTEKKEPATKRGGQSVSRGK